MSAPELDALEAAIKERRKILRLAATRLPRLEERRSAVLAQLQEIESQIAVFTGEAPPPPATAKARARAKPKRSSTTRRRKKGD
jgi:hypothetical protein